jgi:hypothetical protein
VIFTENPGIDPDELMLRVDEEVARGRRAITRTPTGNLRLLMTASAASLSSIEMFLNIAEQAAQVRTKCPSNLRLFPIDKSPRLQRGLLAVLAFVFKDQRNVNDSLIRALRETATVNLRVIEQVEILRSQVNALERELDQIGRLP